MANFTRQQVTILGIFSLVYVASGVAYSMQAIFYPKEAQNKGGSAINFNLVFSIFQLINFIASPVFGKFVNWVEPKHLLLYGIGALGCSCFLFGFLTYASSTIVFFSLPYILRIIEALGYTACVTSILALILIELPEDSATAFGFLTSSYSVGYCVGPVIGAALYELGGFVTPFVILGIFAQILAASSVLILPKYDHKKNVEKYENKTQIISLLKDPIIVAYCVINFIVSAALAFTDVTLEPHMRSLKLNLIYVSIFFLVYASSYSGSALLCGRLYDRRVVSGLVLMLVGSFVAFNGFLLYGPVSLFADLQLSWATFGASVILQGIGLGATNLTFTLIHTRALSLGCEEDMTTNGAVAALWNASFSLGSFIGPLSAGLIMDLSDMQCGSSFYALTQLIDIIIIFAIALYPSCKK